MGRLGPQVESQLLGALQELNPALIEIHCQLITGSLAIFIAGDYSTQSNLENS